MTIRKIKIRLRFLLFVFCSAFFILGCSDSPKNSVLDSPSYLIYTYKDSQFNVDRKSKAHQSYVSGRESLTTLKQSDQGIGLSIDLLELQADDELEVWVMNDHGVSLPELGWGHQFGYEFLKTPDDCNLERYQDETEKVREEKVSVCQIWFEKQQDYRENLKKLFVRQWIVKLNGSNSIQENYATPVYQKFSSDLKNALVKLKPQSTLPQVHSRSESTLSKKQIEVFIPWEALPPISDLDFNRLKILVHIKPQSSELKIPHQNSKIDEISWVQMDLLQPRKYQLGSDCDYSISDLVIDSKENQSSMVPSPQVKAYYWPTQSLKVNRLLVLDNVAKGYQYDLDPKIVSPVLLTATFDNYQVDDQTLFCRPKMKMKWQDKVLSYAEVANRHKELQFKVIKPGQILMMVGPWKYFFYYGSGQCGGCPRCDFAIYLFDFESMKVEKLIDYNEDLLDGVGYHTIGYDYDDDWKKITRYRSSGEWVEGQGFKLKDYVSVSHCWSPQKNLFEECENKKLKQLPQPQPKYLYQYNWDSEK